MKTHFHVDNKEFAEYLKITVQGKEYYFCDELTVEFADCESLDVDVELIKARDYLEIKAKNLFFRQLWKTVILLCSPAIYFADNQDGIGFDKGYASFDPFTVRQSFSISSPDEKTVNITYTESTYDEITKKYTPPKIEYKEYIGMKEEQVAFSPRILKREWNTYHIPAFTAITVVILLLNWLNFSVFAKGIREMPLRSMFENVLGIIGMSISSFVMIALLVMSVVNIVKASKLYKKVLKVNT